MRTCEACGGIIGRDCFNPVECMQITISMQNTEQCTECAEDYPGSIYQPLFDHMHDEHGLTLLNSEMQEIIHIVDKIRAKEAGI